MVCRLKLDYADLFSELFNISSTWEVAKECQERMFVDYKENLENDVFFVLSRAWDIEKNSESPWGIEPQTFGFRVPVLYRWVTGTPRWARSVTKFIWHASCLLLGSAMSIASCLYKRPIFNMKDFNNGWLSAFHRGLKNLLPPSV